MLVRKVFAQLTDCFSLGKGPLILHTKSTNHYQKHKSNLFIFHQFQFNFISIPSKIVFTWLHAEEHSSKVSIGQPVFDIDGRQEELFSWLESLINSSMKCVAVIMAYCWQSIFHCNGNFVSITTNKKPVKTLKITWWQDNIVTATVHSLLESEIGFSSDMIIGGRLSGQLCLWQCFNGLASLRTWDSLNSEEGVYDYCNPVW